jgi:hypothetical protein
LEVGKSLAALPLNAGCGITRLTAIPLVVLNAWNSGFQLLGSRYLGEQKGGNKTGAYYNRDGWFAKQEGR